MNTKLLLRTAFCCTAALIIGKANAQTANGFVGIGTTSPKARLHINSDTSGILIPKYATLALLNSNCLPKLNSTDHKGLQVYVDEASNRGFWFFNGTAFEKVGGSGGGGGSTTSTVYGDGSAGALNITTNTNWVTTPPSSFNFQFTTINVASGITLTIPSGMKLRATGNVTIAGTISVTNPGGSSTGSAPASGICRTFPSSDTGTVALGIYKSQVISLINIPMYGGSGGLVPGSGRSVPGSGGGSFAIYTSGTLSVTGTISAPGANATLYDTTGSSAGGGGGGGGLIVLMAKTSITNSGTISANGGKGGDGKSNSGTVRAGGGGGGGGIVCLLSPAITAGTISVNGGAAGAPSPTGTTTTSYTAGGGASGGNGGKSAAGSVYPATAGGTGHQVTITVANPENLY